MREKFTDGSGRPSYARSMNIHLRYAGKSTTLHSPYDRDEDIIRFLQDKGYLPPVKPEITLDRHPDGVVIRPPAVFG